MTGFPVDGDKFARDLGGAAFGLMADPARCKAMGEAGRKRVEETFAWEAIADQTIEALPPADESCKGLS